MGKSELRIKDIPSEVMDHVRKAFEGFLIPILCQKDDGGGHNILKLVGSGTLVSVGERDFILTAAHVWKQVENLECFYTALTLRHESVFSISIRNLFPNKIWNPERPEFGPDLALIELPHADAVTIRAYKVFLNLSLQKEYFETVEFNAEKALFAISGIVEEFTKLQYQPEIKTITTHTVGRVFFSTAEKYFQSDGCDYIDLGADLDIDGVPSTFGGISGGGLWVINLAMNKSGKISWDGQRRFCGVAFYQTQVEQNRRIVRCLGPKSLYSYILTLLSKER